MDLNGCWKGFEGRVTSPHSGKDEARFGCHPVAASKLALCSLNSNFESTQFEGPPVAASNLTSCSTHISLNEARFERSHPVAASNLTILR